MKAKIASHLLKIKAVFLNPEEPFTWASGIKSPIYCDNRLILGYPEIRKDIETELANLIKKEFPGCQRLMGTATAGIPHAAYVSAILDLPMGYVRGKAKDHGRNNQIEGPLNPGDKVIVIEDLISTGGSSVETVKALKEVGAEVLGLVSIFTYDFPRAAETFKAENVKALSLVDFKTLVEVAVKENYIKDADYQKLLKFAANPSDASWRD
ncbi:MAG: orotate phosphoribosyltransferase [Erysipelotrichales bacterium]|nr:orotate phosphoribosyltransferase [Erysipelotrichales bacterium]